MPLALRFSERLVGRLWADARVLQLEYDAAWLSAADAFPLSPRLPLRAARHSGEELAVFFSNLLPEGPILAAILKLKRLPAGDLYAQLQAFGEDAAGAFSLAPEDTSLPRAPRYQRYSVANIRTDLARLAQNMPLLAQHGELRLSLAGAQNKIPVKYEDGKFWLPAGGVASTHILKPAIRPEARFPGSVLNEAVCLALARACGLDAVEAAVVQVPEPLLVVPRFDRESEGSEIRRLHQLDFCQLAGVLPDQKYEKDGGPSIARVFSILDTCSGVPGRDRLKTIDWLLFNYLIGNADAHGKNLAMLMGAGGKLRLAPCYDLLSTAIYADLDPRMAMAIGGEYRPEWVRQKNWAQLVQDLNINASLLRKRALDLARRAGERMPDCAKALGARRGNRTVDKIEGVLKRRARWMETTL